MKTVAGKHPYGLRLAIGNRIPTQGNRDASATFLLVAVGFVTCFVPPNLFTMGPNSLPGAAYAAAILAIVTFGQNLGMVLGPIVVGYIVEFAGN